MATSQQSRNWSPRLLLALFATPFAGVGIVMALVAIRHLITGESAGAQFLFEALFALIFGGVGFGFMYIAYISGQEEETVQALQDSLERRTHVWGA